MGLQINVATGWHKILIG